MTLLGIDMNGSRIRAVHGQAADFPLPLALDPPAHELHMMLSLADGSAEVGMAGTRRCRRQPHLVCQGFLPHVGKNEGHSPLTPHPSPLIRWRAGRHDLNATQALEHVWKRLEPLCRKADGVMLGLASYLSPAQAEVIRGLGKKVKLPILGSLTLPLAGALAAYAEQQWTESVLVLDIDEHALSIVEVRAVGGHAHVLDVKHLPRLGFRAWRERLINALADLCVLQSRRDPRASPQAEQGLFEQLDAVLDACQKGRMIQVGVQTTSWYQNLLLQPEQVIGYCAGLVRQFLHEITAHWTALGRGDRNFAPPVFSQPEESGKALLLATHTVGRLPGLIPALRTFVDRQRSALKPVLAEGEDFGDGLLDGTQHDSSNVQVLGPDAPARAIHALGPFFRSGQAAAAHLDLTAPLPRPNSVEAGPARLQYQGQDFLLHERHYFLGCPDGRHLVVDDPHHAAGDARHCELIFDQHGYLLFNRSREVTLVNDYSVTNSVALHPGDWIRLGYDGPLVRFLGQPGNHRAFLTA